MKAPVATAAGMVVLSLTGGPAATAVAQRPVAAEPTASIVASWMSATSPNSAIRLLPPAEPWGILSNMVMQALNNAREEGYPVGVAASQQAYGVAAALNAPGAPMPAITDNELGGMVFFWKGVRREIQIELDADSSYFVRIKTGGDVTFSAEGFGTVPMDAVNSALREWAVERAKQFAPSYPRPA